MYISFMVYPELSFLTETESLQDRVFTSNFWQQLFRLSDTKLLMSSSYHPQTNGQTERLNQCLEVFLRCLVHSYPKKWSKWTEVAEFWYNTSHHSALGKSPFEVLYGHFSRQLGISNLNLSTLPDLDSGYNRDNY